MFTNNLLGMDIVVSESAVELVLDWSNCRSPARAKRRHKRGFPQKMKRFERPCGFLIQNKMYVHPALASQLTAQSSALCKKALNRLNPYVG